jgi:superfamily II RNA helicase
MVKLCTDSYPDNSKYESHFELYSYPLSDFQKYAIEAVVEGHHVLVTAHTGSGKTLPAEFAIQHFVGQGKKVIYTSPIKALSNQKYYEFTHKYPHISFGLMTGDIKTNPDADVLIMTTEILMNALFLQPTGKDRDETGTQNLSFNIDIQNDLACVVFDEVHYINDLHRGQTWEKTILMLPRHIQMVMLSATIDAPERFAKWCERDDNTKIVYLASTSKRVVPLTHYGYLVSTEGFIKGLKDKVLEKDIRENTQGLITLQNDRNEFQESGYKTLKRLTDLFDKKQQFVKRKHVLNNLALYLRDREMLPAIAFVFSRKQVEACAQEITVPLLEDDSKVGYTVRRECEQIVRKFPNYHEYLELPEYNQLVALLEKGIGIHHSGMIPVLREIVELMISKRYIKLLFATESFAIGLDCPIKTAIFTGLTKFDGSNQRYLMAHEYTQMAGRAGRRGIDTIGHVVHCNNLFGLPSATDYREMLGGKPQELVSKFRISYGLILNLLKNGKALAQDFVDFVKFSMSFQELQDAIANQKQAVNVMRESFETSLASIHNLQTPRRVIDEFIRSEDGLKTAVNKKRKEFERALESLAFDNRFIKTDALLLRQHYKLERELKGDEEYLVTLESHIDVSISKICILLRDRGFIDISSDNGDIALSNLGIVASGIAEIHPLIVAETMDQTTGFRDFSVDQLIGFLAAFTDVKVDEEARAWQLKSDDPFLNTKFQRLVASYEFYEQYEDEHGLNTGIDYKTALNYNISDFAMEWISCNDEEQCKWFIQTRLSEKGISIGDFVKAVIKISTIAKELSTIAEQTGNMDLLNKLVKIDGKILKYVTTSQSLYV